MRAIAIAFGVLGAACTAAPIRVVTSTPDLKDMVEKICGDDVTVESLMVGTENHHAVPLKPSFLTVLSRCEVLVVNGMEYEHAFVPGALASINNQQIQVGASHYIDASTYIRPCEVPTKIDLALGDLHPLGASHVHIDPGNGILMCKVIYEKLSQLYPDRAAVWKPRFESYVRAIYAKMKELQAYAKDTKGLKVVFYHPGWCYLTERFGWELVGYVEVRAGIPPTPEHVQQLTATMKARECKLMAIEMCYSRTVPDYVASRVGAKVVRIPHHVRALSGCDDYIRYIDTLVRTIVDAARGSEPAEAGDAAPAPAEKKGS
ncbi:MAG: zinc ABC transporter substrate-binding protein [Planctomycetes bacterium]|nr:zinc ABC transporter substrate-binding protein [Planctomycetota bacterium]